MHVYNLRPEALYWGASSQYICGDTEVCNFYGLSFLTADWQKAG